MHSRKFSETKVKQKKKKTQETIWQSNLLQSFKIVNIPEPDHYNVMAPHVHLWGKLFKTKIRHEVSFNSYPAKVN